MELTKNCKKCGKAIDMDRGQHVEDVTKAGAKIPEFRRTPVGPETMQNLCPECWSGHCSRCGVELDEAGKQVLGGRRHFCAACWEEKVREMSKVAAQLLAQRKTKRVAVLPT